MLIRRAIFLIKIKFCSAPTTSKMRTLIVFTLCLLGATFTAGQIDPEPNPSPSWQLSHEANMNHTAANPGTPIIFFGDSITQFWNTEGTTVFDRFYAPLGAANYGIVGDSTHTLLWRILNGEISGLNPRLIVLKIGTNNLGAHTNTGIAAGVLRVVSTLREQLPRTKILLLGILPRSGVLLYDRISAINSIIQSLHDGQNVFFLNMFDQFRIGGEWGVPPADIFIEGLHLNTEGYQLWADTMNPLLNRILSLS